METGNLIVVIFATLTVYYVWNDYKQGKTTKKSFTFVAVLEAVVVISSLVMLLKSIF